MEFEVKDHRGEAKERESREEVEAPNQLLKRLLEMKGSGEAMKLRVLDAKSDPFWLSPARIRDAKWISKLWDERLGEIWRERERIKKKKEQPYDRGLHYILVSLGIECPWGENRRVHSSPMYVNVDSDFNKLISAIRDARNWGLLPWDLIEDRKHVGLERWVHYGNWPGNMEMRPFEEFDGDASYSLGVSMPKVEEISEADFEEDDFDEVLESIVDRVLRNNMTGITSARYQPYYIAVVSEKSGMRSIVRNAIERLDYSSSRFDFLNFEGQASTTVVREFVEKRLLSNVPAENPIREKKIRIFYLSDYDYAGRVMPPAFIQKLFYQLWESGINLDIKVKPLALTKEIVEKYDLPPAPVPGRKMGAKTLQDRWLREFGRIVELEGLDSLHPGVLEDLIVKEVTKYVDKGLAKRVRDQLAEVRKKAKEAITEEVEYWRDDWLEARDKLLKAMNDLNEAIRSKNINETLGKLKKEIDELAVKHEIWSKVEEYQATLKDIYVDYEAPELDIKSGYEADEGDEWLFDSERDPVEQAKILRDYRP